LFEAFKNVYSADLMRFLGELRIIADAVTLLVGRRRGIRANG
jgi:hypothetical protein